MYFFSSSGVRGLGNDFKTAPLDTFNIVYEKVRKMCFSKLGKRIDKSFIRIYDIYTLSCVVCWDGDDIPGTSVPEVKSG